jgi:hypothetical protein
MLSLLKENIHEFSKIKMIPFEIRKQIGLLLIESHLTIFIRLLCVFMKINIAPDKHIILYNENDKIRMDIYIYNTNCCDVYIHFLHFPSLLFLNDIFFKDMEYEEFFSLLIYIIDTFHFDLSQQNKIIVETYIQNNENRIQNTLHRDWNYLFEKRKTTRQLYITNQIHYIYNFSKGGKIPL